MLERSMPKKVEDQSELVLFVVGLRIQRDQANLADTSPYPFSASRFLGRRRCSMQVLGFVEVFDQRAPAFIIFILGIDLKDQADFKGGRIGNKRA